jgi:hypothetical protein
MIQQPKYEINSFGELERTKGFGDNPEVRFSARIAVQYYIYAFHEMMSFCDTNNELFKLCSEADEQKISVYRSRAWASAYGMYALLRTVLEATRKIKSFIPGIDWSDSIYEAPIKNIIDTSNDIVKHPMFNGEGSSAYLAEAGIGIGGEIELNRWTGLDQNSTIISLSPEKDFTTVAEYLRYFSEKIGSSHPENSKI